MKRFLLAPFLFVFIFGCSNPNKTIQQRKIDCADASAGVISYNDFFKKYKIGILRVLYFPMKLEFLTFF